MDDELHEKLMKAANVLHWLGKHDEGNAIIHLSLFCKTQGVPDGATLEHALSEYGKH